jgi:hypothetical protein
MNEQRHRHERDDDDGDAPRIQLCCISGCRRSTLSLYCAKHAALLKRATVDVDGEPEDPLDAA